jgi:hypothetical protein
MDHAEFILLPAVKLRLGDEGVRENTAALRRLNSKESKILRVLKNFKNGRQEKGKPGCNLHSCRNNRLGIGGGAGAEIPLPWEVRRSARLCELQCHVKRANYAEPQPY